MSDQISPSKKYSNDTFYIPEQYPVFNKNKQRKNYYHKKESKEIKDSIILSNVSVSPVSPNSGTVSLDRNRDRDRDRSRKSPVNKVSPITVYNSKSHFVFSKSNKPIKHIKPVLTIDQLENNYNISISPEPPSISPEPPSICSISPEPPSISKSLRGSSISPEPPSISPELSAPSAPSAKPLVMKSNVRKIVKPIPLQNSISSSVTVLNQMSMNIPNYVSINANKYNLHKHIINTIKELVFHYSSLICGTFNSQQFVIDENNKVFHHYILSYELNNAMKLTSHQINYLFIDETISPESKTRLNLQKSIEIITTSDRMNSFIDSINQCFTNVIYAYKVEHMNRGNIKQLVDSTHELQNYSSNHDGNEIYLHIVKISIPEYHILFEVRFLILDNEKTKLDKTYIIPLCIPEGLYDAEHLNVTNNGRDSYTVQHSNSSIEFIVNNINMQIVSLMPKLNDYDYTKMGQYINKIMPISTEPNTTSPYIYEFDIFNTIHKKSDFWLYNKIKEDSQVHTQEHSCQKCNVDISTNARYVIAKCCHKKYHIECMEMNYYPYCNGVYSYLICDCGCTIIDENSCNSKLLIALYRHYY